MQVILEHCPADPPLCTRPRLGFMAMSIAFGNQHALTQSGRMSRHMKVLQEAGLVLDRRVRNGCAIAVIRSCA
jgi:hypothetical protein